MDLPQTSSVNAALEKLSSKLAVVGTERIAIDRVQGRILAEDLLADRDSPALDVSAMDGYALRLAELLDGPILVQTTTAAGMGPAELRAGHAIRIFTGAPVPVGAECVVRREDTKESASEVEIAISKDSLRAGQNIRRQGENSHCGSVVLRAGSRIDAATIGAVASFGSRELNVRRKVRVVVLNTGDELAQPGDEVAAWQIRDSNGPTLQAWLSTMPWVDVVVRRRVDDSLAGVRTALRSSLEDCDAIVLTGGVSMGDTDFVPAAISELGGETIFHRLPIRPGKPVLGAALNGKLLLGLPGNPVSVAVTSRVFGTPLLSQLAGCHSEPARPLVELSQIDDKRIDLTWYRLVQVDADGQVRLVASQGSGDVVSLSHSHGFVEIVPGTLARGPVRLTLW